MGVLPLKARAASLQAHILVGSSAESSVIDRYFAVENVHECSLRGTLAFDGRGAHLFLCLWQTYAKCAANARLRHKI